MPSVLQACRPYPKASSPLAIAANVLTCARTPIRSFRFVRTAGKPVPAFDRQSVVDGTAGHYQRFGRANGSTRQEPFGIRTAVERPKFFAVSKLWTARPPPAFSRTPKTAFEMPANARRTVACRVNRELAGRQGFEPRYRGPEPRVLPLDDLPVPVRRARRARTFDYMRSKAAPASARDWHWGIRY
jgi:hypothetical protein